MLKDFKCPIDGKPAELMETNPNGSIVYRCGGEVLGASAEELKSPKYLQKII